MAIPDHLRNPDRSHHNYRDRSIDKQPHTKHLQYPEIDHIADPPPHQPYRPQPIPIATGNQPQRVSNNDIGYSGSAGGKPRLIPTPEIFYQKISEYQEHCKKYDEVPLVVGFAVWLDLSSSTIYSYKDKKGFKEPLQLLKDISHNALLQGGLKKQYNDKITTFVLKNAFGYAAEDTNINLTSHTVEVVLATPPSIDLPEPVDTDTIDIEHD